jgi:hypothetical protein
MNAFVWLVYPYSWHLFQFHFTLSHLHSMKYFEENYFLRKTRNGCKIIRVVTWPVMPCNVVGGDAENWGSKISPKLPPLPYQACRDWVMLYLYILTDRILGNYWWSSLFRKSWIGKCFKIIPQRFHEQSEGNKKSLQETPCFILRGTGGERIVDVVPGGT